MSEVSRDESQIVDETETGPAESVAQPATTSTLRLWPAALFLALLWAFMLIPKTIDEISLPVIMAQFFGPAFWAAFILLWWTFFSRASWAERGLGLLGLSLTCGLATALAHESVQGFGVIAFFIPWGITGFSATQILARSLQAPLRTWLALTAATFCFGYWDLVRADEFRGDFVTTFNWRWEPTAEERFLKQLAARGQTPALVTTDAKEEPPSAPEWPSFRGQNRDSVVPDVVLAEDWKAQPPREIWKQSIGPGWSSFAVAGDRLYTQEQRGEQELVICYDAATGAELWKHEDNSRFWEVIGGAGPRATPTLANGKLYALGANGTLNCLDPLTGDEIWSVDIGKDAERKPPVWGFASSPLVTHGFVIVHGGGQGDLGILAYTADSGELRWTSPAGDDTYSSPHLATLDGKECVLMLTNTGIAFADPVDGRALAKHDFLHQAYRVVQPLVLSENSVLLGSAMGTGTRRIEVSWTGKQLLIKDPPDWTSRRMNPYFNDYVAHNGFLYGFDNNIFACVDIATGKRKWKRGRYGNGQVLLLPAQDQLLVISENGELVLMQATPEKHIELAKHQAITGRTWNHHVLVGNRVYVRNGEQVACLELPLKASPSDQKQDTNSTDAKNEKAPAKQGL